MKRDVGDDHAADAHGRKASHGCELAGAPDLNVDGFQRRLCFLSGKLVRQPPARGPRNARRRRRLRHRGEQGQASLAVGRMRFGRGTLDRAERPVDPGSQRLRIETFAARTSIDPCSRRPSQQPVELIVVLLHHLSLERSTAGSLRCEERSKNCCTSMVPGSSSANSNARAT